MGHIFKTGGHTDKTPVDICALARNAATPPLVPQVVVYDMTSGAWQLGLNRNSSITMPNPDCPSTSLGVAPVIAAVRLVRLPT